MLYVIDNECYAFPPGKIFQLHYHAGSVVTLLPFIFKVIKLIMSILARTAKTVGSLTQVTLRKANKFLRPSTFKRFRKIASIEATELLRRVFMPSLSYTWVETATTFHKPH